MNLDSTLSASSGPPPPTRTSRGAIASQACETCRSRKQKCDEQRPKCSLCQRMKLDCRYREPLPTKKDKTLVEILERLTSLEGKIDRIPGSSASISTGGSLQTSSSSQSLNTEIVTPVFSSSSLHLYRQHSHKGIWRYQPYHHGSAVHKILSWPVIEQGLLQTQPSNINDLKSLEQEGSALFIRLQRELSALPLDESLADVPFVGIQTQASRASGGARTTFPTLTPERTYRLATAYFDTFNFIYPFMDRQNFISDTLTKVHTEGFNGDVDSVIALLVFALGELAIEGSQGNPIDGQTSGVRGGTDRKPPGLALFTEARKRIGFVFTECDLENVQIYCLSALYFQSCFRHVDFWRMTTSASSACRILITCYPIDWSTPRGDLIKRAYWHCVIMETGLYLELDLPLSDLVSLGDQVGIPSFNSPFCEADHRGNQASHFEAHYASQVALRHLFANIHHSIYETGQNSDAPSAPKEEFTGPTFASLNQLASQLAQWRSMLPRELQWRDDDPASFPSSQSFDATATGYNQQMDPNLSPQQSRSDFPLFSTDLHAEPAHYPYLYDIQVALLRTRYYYAKYMVYRPLIYKALHFPEQMTEEDAQGVAECLRSCVKWPLTLSPPSRRKRMVPYLFCWSQIFLGILLIFHTSRHNPMLRDIRTQFCGARFEAEVDQSVELMIDWIRDLKSCDPIALWCYKILQPIYDLESRYKHDVG